MSDRKISERDIDRSPQREDDPPQFEKLGLLPHSRNNVCSAAPFDANLEALSGDVIPVWVQHSESQPERIERSRPSAKSHRLSSHRKSFGAPGRQDHS